MTNADIPSPELLRNLLIYVPSTGKFFWSCGNLRCDKAAYKRSGKETFKSKDKAGYFQAKINGKMHRANRIAWAIFYGKWPCGFVDHVNGDVSDNRIENLKVVSSHESMKNRSMRKDNTSGFNGVFWCKRRNKWFSQVKLNGRNKHLGYFVEKQNAIAARRKANTENGFSLRHGHSLKIKEGQPQ